MRAFSGIVDLPALFIVVAALIIIALSNGFAVKKTALSARALLMEVALLMLLINFVPLFDDPLNFMTLPYVLSFSLVIFVLVGFVLISLHAALPENSLPATTATSATAPLLFRLAAVVASVLGIGFLASGNASLMDYFPADAVVFFVAILFWLSVFARFVGHQPILTSTIETLPNIAILGLVLGISAAVLDVYEIGFLLPLLGFGVSVAFLSLLLRLLLRLGSGSASNMGFGRYALLCLLLVASVCLVLLAQAIA